MWPEWVSNSGPLTYESDALPIALRGLASDWIPILGTYASRTDSVQMLQNVASDRGLRSLLTGSSMQSAVKRENINQNPHPSGHMM